MASVGVFQVLAAAPATSHGMTTMHTPMTGRTLRTTSTMGGLGEALGLMVQLPWSRGTLCFSLIEVEAERHCNTAFSYGSTHGAVVVATHELHLDSTPTELLITYGIESYWMTFLAQHAADWGLQHPMVQAVLWCTMSPDSSWPPSLHHSVTSRLPPGVARLSLARSPLQIKL